MARIRISPARRPAGERVARASDVLLDLAVLAFAAWTVIYHACLLLDLGAVWAAVAEAVAIVPCALIAGRRHPRPAPQPATAGHALPRQAAARRRRIAVAVNLGAAAVAAVLFGWVSHAWVVVWLLWLIAAAAGIALTLLPHNAAARPPSASGSRGAPVALAWAAVLAVLSLFIVRPDTDDTYYVHLSAWIAEHGTFPLRDTLFTDERMPAIFYPPVSSFEALLGTLARGIPIALPDLVYLVVVPVASVLAVLALWRLLRSWRVPLVGLALTVAILFLLYDARGHWLPGSYFIGRNWQGKVLFVTILVPVIFALLQDQVERPTRRGLVLLGAAGAAGVGLTTTAIFVTPVLAIGCLVPVAARRPRQALAALVATVVYPLAVGAATLLVDGRNPDKYTGTDLLPPFLTHHALGVEQFGAVALFGALAAAVAIPRRTEARMVASVALLVGLLYAPGVPGLIFDVTGLGRVLWRLTWALPIAAGLGALTVRPLARARPVVLRAVVPAAACVAIVALGTPLWSAEAKGTLADHPAWKLFEGDVATAQAILARTGPGDTVLAPMRTSQALLTLSGTVRTVDPLNRYVAALGQFTDPRYGGRYHPRVKQRFVLSRFAKRGIGPLTVDHPARYVKRSLRQVGVDVACLFPGFPTSGELLASAGYTRMHGVPNLECWRAP